MILCLTSYATFLWFQSASWMQLLVRSVINLHCHGTPAGNSALHSCSLTALPGGMRERTGRVKVRIHMGWNKDSLMGQKKMKIIMVTMMMTIIMINKLEYTKQVMHNPTLTTCWRMLGQFPSSSPSQLSPQFMTPYGREYPFGSAVLALCPPNFLCPPAMRSWKVLDVV